MTQNKQSSSDVKDTIRAAYARIAQTGGSCCDPTASCCGSPNSADIAENIGYTPDELGEIPEDANMGLSCGNPTAIASLSPGEIVLDLGCGAGFDVFIAARKVAPSGCVIGVDMTPDMIIRARKNAHLFSEDTGLENVEFRLGEIEHLPVADALVDVVISNCVINLSDEKPQVWREIARVLKPGGRIAISDLALLQPLPEKVKTSVEALVGCVAGAALIADTERMIHDAGLTVTSFDKHDGYIDAMTRLQDPLYRQIIKELPQGTRVADFIVSMSITAAKPE